MTDIRPGSGLGTAPGLKSFVEKKDCVQHVRERGCVADMQRACLLRPAVLFELGVHA